MDAEGAELLARYVTVLTGSHPEYHTPRTLDAHAGYLARGGRLVYLGGNGLNCDVEFLDEQTCIYRNEEERRLREPGTTRLVNVQRLLQPNFLRR